MREIAIGIIPNVSTCIFHNGNLEYHRNLKTYEDYNNLFSKYRSLFSGEVICSIAVSKCNHDIENITRALRMNDIAFRHVSHMMWQDYCNLTLHASITEKGFDDSNLNVLLKEVSNVKKHYPHLNFQQRAELKNQMDLEIAKENAKLNILQAKRFQRAASKYALKEVELWQATSLLLTVYEWNH